MAAPIEIADAGEEQPVEVGASRTVPGTLPVLPLRETIPLPDTLIPLAVGQERSVALVDDVLRGNRMLVMVASRHPDKEVPGPDDLFEVGVVGAIARMIKVPDGTMRILVQGGQRVHIDGWVHETPYLVAEISELPDVDAQRVGRARGAHPQRPADVLLDRREQSRTCPRSCSSRSPTSTTRARSATSSPARCA